ncbi:hypothetical protein M408DRAFT_161600 [Serendipita vermifera MAFF 305830]|uniref:Uncharacterized protein n=1 Tax=Serendipita vermifera MAFF 305830 TaxID=933852 RepID=A0A0C3AYI4_SERVB|nr:hypothetical protein M408DRAFT_226648 [Serendipita vermifera MAFF 305830]KIM27942.1 hypothetical protein M408DRAFT_161600 [Serendipita vermifera MAFF 305830]
MADGSSLVLVTGPFELWDAETGEGVTGPLRGHVAAVNSVSFAPGGKLIVSGSDDNVIRVFSVPISVSTQDSACAIPCFNDSSGIESGWVLGPNFERLFWVPPCLRAGLYRPGNTLVIGSTPTVLDLKPFVHGESWVQCKEPNDL